MPLSLGAWLESLGLNQRRCAHCFAPFFASEASGFISRRLCRACQIELAPYIGPRCRLCGLPSLAPGAAGKPAPGLCGQCLADEPPWLAAAYHGLYEGALRDVVLRLKYDHELHLAWLLAELLLEASRCLPRPDCIVAIPQFPAKLRQRGFNQAHELARQLARLGGWRADALILERRRGGAPQEALGRGERLLNMKGAFAAARPLAGQTVWLVDDVLTTGSTMGEAAKALLAAGAGAVCALFAARTPLA